MCGITSSNPDDIHYIKVGGEAEALREVLLKWTPECAPNMLFDDNDDDEDIGAVAAADDDVLQKDGLTIDLELDDLTLVDDKSIDLLRLNFCGIIWCDLYSNAMHFLMSWHAFDKQGRLILKFI